jgi:multiple sugar transport system permease protein
VKRKVSHKKNDVWGYIFIFPGMVFFIIFVLVPLFNALKYSLYDYNIINYKWVGLKNFRMLITDNVFNKSLANTFIFVIGIVPTTIIISLFLSVNIIKLNGKLQSFFRGAFYLPVVTSSVAMSIVWKWIYNPVNGLMNYFLSIIGVEPVNWLGDSSTVLFSLVLVVLSWSVGTPVILYCASLGSIPKTYYEAADIDGANKWQLFKNITLPLLRPTTLYIIVTSTIGTFQTFVVVQLMSGGGPHYASSTILFLLYKTAFEFNNYGLASAMGIILFFIICIISIIQFKYLSSYVEY